MHLAKQTLEREWREKSKTFHVKMPIVMVTKPNLEYLYNAMGNRINKILKPSNDPLTWVYTRYVRDAQGNVMATYKKENINPATDPEARAGMKQRLLDSYSAYARDSNLISFLNNDSTLEAKKLLVSVYIKRREGANATTAMTAIPNTGTENIKFRNFYNIFINLINNNKRYDQLSSVQRETVISISTTTTDVSANAQAYLDWLNGTRTVRVPEQGVPARHGAIANNAWLQSDNYNIQSIPNPVNGNETNIRCFVPVGRQGVILVYNALGEKQIQITLHEGINDALIDVSQLTKGVYPFVLTIDNAKVASNRIIKL